jgi:hypothetical protein
MRKGLLFFWSGDMFSAGLEIGSGLEIRHIGRGRRSLIWD